MADHVLDDGKLMLIDNFPGVADNSQPMPSIGSSGKFCGWDSSPVFPLGTKRTVYDETNKGFSTFTYLKLCKGSTDVDVAAKSPCGLKTSEGNMYSVCNDGGDIAVDGPIAVSLQSLDYGVSFTAAGATAVYGWFWTGGVCPVDTVSDLDGNFATSAAAVTAYAGMKLADVAGAACAFATKEATDTLPASAINLAAVTTT